MARYAPSSHPLRHVDDYLAAAQQAGASDVHLDVDLPPIWRLHGTLQPIWSDAPRFTPDKLLPWQKVFFLTSTKPY